MKSRKSPVSVKALQNETIELKDRVLEYKAQIRKLQKKNAKLEAEKFAALELVRARKKLNPSPKREPMSKFEIARRVAFTDELKRRGLIHGKPLIEKSPNPALNRDAVKRRTLFRHHARRALALRWAAI